MADWFDRYVANLKHLGVPHEFGPKLDQARRGDWFEGQPVGTIDHHFVNSYSSTDGVSMLTNGYEGGPVAPVVNQYLADVRQDPTDDGRLYIICRFPTGHPGKGSRRVLNDVRAGRAATGDAAARGLPDDLPQSEAERWYFGTEVQNPGDGTPLTAAQRRTLTLADAAFCRSIGRDSSAVIQHREHSARKQDIHRNALDAMQHRRDVQAVLDHWDGRSAADWMRFFAAAVA